MAQSPVVLLIIVISCLAFEGMIYGSEIAEKSFPTFEQPSSGGLFGALEAAVAVLQAAWGAIAFFVNLVTFNVPGAPWFVRLVVGSAFGGGITWSIASLIRGV